MPHVPAHTSFIRGLLLRVVAPVGGGAVIALAVWSSGLAVGVATTLAVIVASASHQLREQRLATQHPGGALATTDHAWYRQLDRLARRAGVQTPSLYLDPCWGTIAGTVGYQPGSVGIIIEGGVMRALSLAGSAGLLAHELGHIVKHHVSHALLERVALQSAARVIQLFGFAALSVGHLGAPWSIFALISIWLLPIRAADLAEAALLRRKELAADRFAADLVGPAVTGRGLREFDSYVEAQRDWAQALYDAQNPSLWSRLARSLRRSYDASVLLAAMEQLEEAADRAVAMVDSPPPTRDELLSHTRRLRRLVSGLPVSRARAPQWRAPSAPLRAHWADLTSSHPSTEDRLRHLFGRR